MDEYLSEHYAKIKETEFDFRKKYLLKMIEPHLEGEVLLDIGCGKGDLVKLALDKGMGAFGLEPNKELVKLGKELYGGLDILHSDLNHFHSVIKIDTVAMIDVLEHIKDDMATLKKLRRISNKLILVVPSPPWLYGERDKKVGHFRRYSKKEISSKLQSVGFRIDHIQYWNMLGLVMYFVYERILHKDLNIYSLRDKPSVLNKILNLWFKYVENNINLRFGMGIICVAR